VVETCGGPHAVEEILEVAERVEKQKRKRRVPTLDFLQDLGALGVSDFGFGLGSCKAVASY